jgi:hypothetical protein
MVFDRYCHFIIDGIDVMYVYEKHTGFKTFTEEMTKLKQEPKLNKDCAGDEFYKLVLNGSYGYDIMNEEKISKCFICNTESKQYSTHFLSARRLNENNYQVKMENTTYGCRTPVTQGFFTLEMLNFGI